MKTVKAVAPYIYPGGINFKHKPYEAWVRLGGQVAPAHYPPRWLHGWAFRYEIPTWGGSIVQKFRSSKVLRAMLSNGQNSEQILNCHREARLRFVQPVAIKFDTFPDYAIHEVIPFFWDCWPDNYDETADWLRRYEVRTAMFTSSQTAEVMQRRFPDINILYVPEGIDVKEYGGGLSLKQRENPLYEIGQGRRCFLKTHYPEDYERISILPANGLLPDKESFIRALCEAKVTVTFPRCDMMPEETGGIETLTQRYWEAMLTRSVIVGRAPKELIELIGYNPVIDMDKTHPIGQIENILAHIEEYQPMVDKNRETALKMGDWNVRMTWVADWLDSCGYDCGIKH